MYPGIVIQSPFSLFADYGEEKSLALANKNSEQVMEALESLVKEGGKKP